MIGLSGILNPMPAINTSPFILYIGNDNSANDSFSAVSLTPADLTAITITFSPAYVNTTGSMHINFQPTNPLPAGSTIVVEFPFSITWARDVNQAHQLPIDGTLSCSAHSNVIDENNIEHKSSRDRLFRTHIYSIGDYNQHNNKQYINK